MRLVGLTFQDDEVMQAALTFFLGMISKGGIEPHLADFGNYLDGMSKDVAIQRRSRIIRKLENAKLLTRNRQGSGRGLVCFPNHDYRQVIIDARLRAGREASRAGSASLSRSVPNRAAAYDDKPEKQTKVVFLRQMFTNNPDDIFSVAGIMAGGFRGLTHTKSERAQHAAVREAIRRLVEEGLVTPINTGVFVSSAADQDIKDAAKKSCRREIDEYFQDDANIGILRDLPENQRMLRRALDRRFDRARDIHKNDGRTVGYGVNDDSVSLLIRDASVHPLLTEEGEKYLFKIYNEVDDYAVSEWVRERIFKSNMRMVINLAKRYPIVDKDLGLSDLIAEGNMGLLHAIDLFDPRRGYKLSTFATFWIKQAISRAIDQKKSLIRVPGDKAAEYGSLTRSLSNQGLTWGDGSERIKRALSIDDEKLQRVMEVGTLLTAASLNKTIGDDGNAEIGDLAAFTEDSYDTIELLPIQELFERYATGLSDRAKGMLLMRYSRNDENPIRLKSFREIGEAYGVTAEAVRLVVARAISVMSDEVAFAKVNIDDYLFTQ